MDYGGHIRNCFIPIKEELDKLTKECNNSENSPTNQNSVEQVGSLISNMQSITNKATSSTDHQNSHQFTCSSCKKSFRYKLALKKHVCANSNRPTENIVQKSAMSHLPHNSSNNTELLMSNRRSNIWHSSSSEESRDENAGQFDNGQQQNVNLHASAGSKKSSHRVQGRNKKSRGRPVGAARIPRIPISRRNIGSCDCPDCGESYPNKEILKLHTCKSYLGLETESTYRTDRQNVELFSRTTQRRSLEESPPVSPGRSNKKKRMHRGRNRNRSHSRSSSKSESKSSTRSGDVDNECNQNSLMSTSDEDECKPSCPGNIINDSEKNPITTTSQHNAILSSVNSANQVQESDEMEDTENLVTNAINSLENEMAESSSIGPTPGVTSSCSRLAIHTSMVISSPNASSNNPRSTSPLSDKYSEKTQQNCLYEVPVDPMMYDKSIPQKHDRRNIKESVRCEQCGKPFLDQNLLTDHILEEHDSDPFG